MSIRIPSKPAVLAIMGSSTLRTSLTESVYATSSLTIFSLMELCNVTSAIFFLCYFLKLSFQRIGEGKIQLMV